MKFEFFNIEEKLPTPKDRVMAICEKPNGYRYFNFCQYISPRTILSEDFLNEEYEIADLEEYDEKNDCYWVAENWFEDNAICEMNYVITDRIISWARLPRLNNFENPELLEVEE